MLDLRNTYVRNTAVSSNSGNPTLLCGYNPHRMVITFGPNNFISPWYFSPTPVVDLTTMIVTNISPVTYTLAQHGAMVTGEWYGVNTNSQLIIVWELIYDGPVGDLYQQTKSQPRIILAKASDLRSL